VFKVLNVREVVAIASLASLAALNTRLVIGSGQHAR
jgi:hypothetical protein